MLRVAVSSRLVNQSLMQLMNVIMKRVLLGRKGLVLFAEPASTTIAPGIGEDLL